MIKIFEATKYWLENLLKAQKPCNFVSYCSHSDIPHHLFAFQNQRNFREVMDGYSRHKAPFELLHSCKYLADKKRGEVFLNAIIETGEEK